MPVVALELYLVYVVVAFGVRTFAHYRRTGSTGFKGVARGSGAAARIGALLFVVAIALGLLAPVLDLAGVVRRVAMLDSFALRAVGTSLYVAGFVTTIIAQSQMGVSWRIGVDPAERTDLVTTGIFQFVRNPIFAAMLLVAGGLALLDPTPVAIVAVTCLLLASQIQVRLVEEPYLIDRHGRPYREYAARAGRFVPGAGLLSAVGRSRSEV